MTNEQIELYLDFMFQPAKIVEVFTVQRKNQKGDWINSRFGGMSYVEAQAFYKNTSAHFPNHEFRIVKI